jgi:hypothetical protein
LTPFAATQSFTINEKFNSKPFLISLLVTTCDNSNQGADYFALINTLQGKATRQVSELFLFFNID